MVDRKLSNAAGQLTHLEKATEQLDEHNASVLWKRTNAVHDRVIVACGGHFSPKVLVLLERVQGLRGKIMNELPTSLRAL